MNNLKVTIVFLLTIFATLGIGQPVEAQRRHNNRKVVVRRNVVIRPYRVHRTVVLRRAHFHYNHLPRWGTFVTVIPPRAVVIRTRNTPFYYNEGIYYTQRNSGYVVVRPSLGIRISALPVGYRKVAVGPGTYYYYYGTFYTQVSNEYEVVDAPEGAIVDALPDGYEIKTIKGTEYYVLDDVYYAEVEDSEFEDGVGYEVVKVG